MQFGSSVIRQQAAPLQALGEAMPCSLRGQEPINMQSKGKLNLVSLGPGSMHLVPPLAEIALRESDVVIGYKLYFTWIPSLIEGKEIHSFY